MPSSEALMTHSDPNPSNDSVAVAKEPQTTVEEGPPQAARMCGRIVHCGSREGGSCSRKCDRTWRRLENTHENGPESTP